MLLKEEEYEHFVVVSTCYPETFAVDVINVCIKLDEDLGLDRMAYLVVCGSVRVFPVGMYIVLIIIVYKIVG